MNEPSHRGCDVHRPEVSVIVPAYNEERDIAGCIDAIAAQTYPLGKVELIVIDGASTDRTAAVVARTAAGLPLRGLRVIRNPQRRTAAGLNHGLRASDGEIVVRLDARSRVEPSYIERTVDVLLREPGVAVVGGGQCAVARSGRLRDRGIARALRNRLTTGLSRYRRLTSSGPADTVWMGVFRRVDLVEMGGWGADMGINEDWELNARFRGAGRQVYVLADVRSSYLPRRTLRDLARQYHAYGRAKGSLWARGMRPAPRQLALLAVPPLAALTLALLTRRFGSTALLVVPAALIGADALGSDGPARDAAERCTSAAAIVTYSSSWWLGAVAGLIAGARRGDGGIR